MSNPHVDGRMEGAALRRLSTEQIKKLILLGREAYLTQYDSGAISETTDFDSWRHYQVRVCVERDGFRQCRNEDYLPLKAHFLRMLGREKEADACLAKSQMEPRAHALHAFRAACEDAQIAAEQARERFDASAYASGFLKNRRGVALDHADAKTIWHAVYVLRRKAKLLRESAEAEVPF